MRNRGGTVSKTNPANDNQGDLLLGAPAIANFLGVTQRQVYRLVADRLIPSFKLGSTISARRSSLTAWMDGAELRVAV
ncbi:helix-turn-helix domain-containing protein [Rhizobium sp. P44RR-XXIV]|uniref:helix-turn-helix domain-containing protein n=1 Tax=Rhizobium sp. P44RR-XXIV TaxID=1921145 RepID=UPI000987507C|nr:helix-turn-helix domain-containing protein [Rhizobium sp. P44RR-XXIV]